MGRRRLITLLVVVDIVVLLVVVGLVWRPWDSGDAEPPLSDRLAPPTAPPGYVLSSAYGADALAGSGGTGTAVLIADEGATSDDGRWVGIVTLPATADRGDPDVIFPGETRRPTTAGSVAAVAGETYDGRVGVTAGPVDGRLVSVVGDGITEDDLLAVAAAVADAGGTTPTSTDVLDGTVAAEMDVVGSTGFATADVTSSITGALLLPGEGSASVTYQPTTPGGLAVQVTNRPAPDDADALLAFLLGDGTATVHGRDAVVGDAELAAFRLSAVVWEAGGRLLAVTGPAPAEGLVPLAESIHELDAATWTNLLNT